jgi:hypothetical protein
LRGSSDSKTPAQLQKTKGLRALLREVSDDEEETMGNVELFDDPERPWLRYYQAYLDVREQIPEGWTTIQWWGVGIPV